MIQGYRDQTEGREAKSIELKQHMSLYKLLSNDSLWKKTNNVKDTFYSD